MSEDRIAVKEGNLESKETVTDNTTALAQTDTEVFERLSERFDESDVKSRPGGGGKRFKYLPEPVVRNRLSEVLGLNWDWEIVSETETEFRGKQCIIVRGRLTITLPESGRKVTREGHGGAELGKGNAAGDSYKIAASNALKKSAYLMGIGAYFGLDSEESQDDTSTWGSAPQSAPSAGSWGSAPSTPINPSSGGWGGSDGGSGGSWGS